MIAIWQRWLVVSALSALAACAAATTSPGAGDLPGRAGRLGEFQGNVWLYDTEQGQWSEGQRNRALTEGDRLSTEGAARAEVQVGSTELRLGGGSELEFLRLDDERMVLQLHRGSLALRVRSGDVAREIEVRTVEAAWFPERAGHYRIDRADEVSAGSVWRGGLRAHTRVGAQQVAAGQRLEITLQSPDGNPALTWSRAAVDAFSDWVARDEQRDERTASQRYVSPEMTGVDDLDRYGRWDRHPDHGMVWMPSVVSAGWAPYRYGRWYWHVRWGWTWLDDAPWGFAPFHYGRWLSWNGRWCWWPGAYVPRPVFAPALVAWVGGPSVSFSVSIGSGPAVGWLPLAPYDVYVPGFAYGPRYYERVNHPYRPPPSHPRYRRQPPSEPVMYGNKGVPGAVTMVPANVLQQRQPVQAAAVDDHTARRIVGEHGLRAEAPLPAPRPPRGTGPAARPVPGGAEPSVPGAGRAPPMPATAPAPSPITGPATGPVTGPATPSPQATDARRDRPAAPSAPPVAGGAPHTVTTVPPATMAPRPGTTQAPAPPQAQPKAPPAGAPITPAPQSGTVRPSRPETTPPSTAGRAPPSKAELAPPAPAPAPQAPERGRGRPDTVPDGKGGPKAEAPAGAKAAPAAPPKAEAPARAPEPRNPGRDKQANQ